MGWMSLSKVRAAAAKAVAHLGRETARKPLFDALGDPDPWVRFFAARSVGKHGYTQFSDRLKRMISEDSAPQVRIECLKALGRIHPPEVVPFLSEFVNHEDPDMARAAVEALGFVGPPHATAALVRAIRVRDPFLKIAVIQALGNAPEREDGSFLVPKVVG
mgnify:CR=1 FL=1